jgi:hypothetical protein
MTLATQTATMTHPDFVNYIRIGWKKGEMIMRLAEGLTISRYLAWKVVMASWFEISATAKAFHLLQFL